ncbi:hypothetical protein K6119_02800 [Paracrocinitomix mangrovi]|uniref:hypothetical protein n=1 Tax=Paracrocinitomix mangrovi TaxID=2862509 RepID=UPI001C8EA560|nr:hypothetical protein [Paracrocinitomix mangrovi]UKN02449.1 hypothetical protein K6119_02800 [Paracrocinitomix mangrovi]
MKYFLPFVLLLLFVACDSNNNEIDIDNQEQKQDEVNLQITQCSIKWDNFTDQLEIESADTDYQKEQDSLRKVLMELKESTALKESILQELYLRSNAEIEGDLVKVGIDFNLHGFDCGAPDCYSTSLSFSFPQSELKQMPDKIEVTISETGCVDKEYNTISKFHKKAFQKEFVIYGNNKNQYLVIYNYDPEIVDYALFFDNLDTQPTKENAMHVLSLFEESEEYEDVPYRSRNLSFVEYEFMIPSK